MQSRLMFQQSNLVRINGKRVNLSDLENKILNHKQIEDCAIIHKSDKETGDQLAVFIKANGTVDLDKLIQEQALEAFMAPNAFVFLNSFPRSADGSIDRKRLMSYELSNLSTIPEINAKLLNVNDLEEGCAAYREVYEASKFVHYKDLVKYKKPFASARKNETSQKQANEQVGDRPLAILHGKTIALTENEPQNLSEVLLRTAEKFPEHGITYIQSDGATHFQSYATLKEEALRVLSGLLKTGIQPGMKVLMLMDRNDDFIPLFWACVLGGLVPVPITVPKVLEEKTIETDMINNIYHLLERPKLVSSAANHEGVQKMAKAYGIDGNDLLNIERLRNNDPHSEIYMASPDELAMMLFTSGSTGIPKGVMQPHKNIIARERAVTVHNSFHPQEVSLNWMPLEHVGGIVMFHVKEMYIGCHQVQVKTDYILSNPVNWLKLMSDYKVTMTWAPNFAYSLVNESLAGNASYAFDLSQLHFIMNAGEAIHAGNSKKFVKNLEIFGLPKNAMVPVWGMSETCSGVMYSHAFTSERETGIQQIEKVNVGQMIRPAEDQAECAVYTELGGPVPGISIRIVDNNDVNLPEGVVGRIQIKGDTVTIGYYKNNEINNQVFSKDGWFDTGDLGFIYNQSMCITGRAKDIIIINGVNYNNSEIEAVIEEIEGVAVSYTAVCGVRDRESDTDQMAVFYCSDYQEEEAVKAQIERIKRKVNEKIGLQVSFVVPVAKSDIPKTNIGKIQRTKLTKNFEDGFYDEIIKKVDLLTQNDNTIPEWFYKPSWNKEKISRSEAMADHEYLVIQVGEANTELLASQLASEAKSVQVIKLNAGSALLNIPDDTDTIDRIVVVFGNKHTAECANHEKTHQNEIVLALKRLVSVLNIDNETFTSLSVVTEKATQVFNETHVNVQLGTLSGFLKSLVQETALNVRHVDVEDLMNAKSISEIILELKHTKHQLDVAYRNGSRLCMRLAPVKLDTLQHESVDIEYGGIYLVTGGLGGIGFEIGKALIKNYAAKLIVLGSQDLNQVSQATGSTASERIKVLKELTYLSEEVMYRHGDIADSAFIKAVIAEGEQQFNQKLSGVFHLAGLGNLKDHFKASEQHWIKSEADDYYNAMYQAKIYGTLAIHEAISERYDVAFIAFSSINGYFGASNFAAYSSAASFLDNYCRYRKSNGYPRTYCIAWSMWDNLGMNKENTTSNAGAKKGFDLISAKRGVNSLFAALQSRTELLYVGLDKDNAFIRKHMTYDTATKLELTVYAKGSGNFNLKDLGIKPLLKRDEKAAVIHVKMLPKTETGIIDMYELSMVEPNRMSSQQEIKLAETETEKKLVAILQEVLSVSQVSLEDDFFSLGGHSLKAMQVTSRIFNAFGIKLPLQMIFQHSKVGHLAEVLESYLSKHDVVEAEEIVIPKLPKQAHYELSHAQKRVFFLMSLEPNSFIYNILGVWNLKGQFNIEVLDQILNQLAKRHEVLRATFTIVDGKPVQRIAEEVQFKTKYVDLSEVADQETQISEHLKAEAERIYDLENGPLMFVTVIKHDADQYKLVIAQHHIISDGWSLGLLVREIGECYNAHIRQETHTLQTIEVSLTDFIDWHNKAVDAQDKQRDYWLEKLSGELPILELPLDKPRPAVQTYNGKTKLLRIEQAMYDSLQSLSKASNATVFMVMLALYKVMLHKFTGQNDIIVGAPTAGRNSKHSEPLVGMFVNTISLRSQLNADMTFAELLESVKKTASDGYDNQDYPFDKLVDELGIDRNLTRTPVFQVMMGHLDVPLEMKLDQLEIEEQIREHEVAKFDLTLHLFERSDFLSVYFEYNTDILEETTVDNWMRYFNNIMTQVIENPNRTLKDISMLDEAVKALILNEWSGKTVPYPKTECIQDLFKKQCLKSPTATALWFNGKVMTYQELDAKSDKLASHLISQGIRQGDIVGILCDKSFEMIVGLLSILKAGAAYLPLNHKDPHTRIAYYLEASAVKTLLTTRNYAEKSPQSCKTVLIDGKEVEAVVRLEVPIKQEATDLAYVMYTSGSTGVPKGVMVQHNNVVRLVQNTNYCEFTQGEKLLQTGALSFDASTFEIWGALINGMTLYLADENTILNSQKLKETIQKHDISTMWLSAPLFNQLSHENEDMFNGLKTLIIGGDALSPRHVNAVMAKCKTLQIVNGYGPTENTTFSTCFPIDNAYEGNIPIGYPIHNSTAYVVGTDGNLQPPGIPGELYVGGEGVARGYLNDEALTNSKFIDCNFTGKKERCYKTGDVVRWRNDGAIEFIGRVDNQVKIRGFRIECGEVAKCIMNHEAIEDAIVTVKTHEGGHKQLIAYYVLNKPSEVDLKKYLKKLLPDYMIPSAFIEMEKLPLSKNGKIDFKLLPELSFRASVTSVESEEANEIEEKIILIFKEVLKVDSVSRDQSFFDIGGDSILSIKVVSRLKQEGISIEPKTLFMYQSPRELAVEIQTNSAPERTSERTHQDYLMKLNKTNDSSCRLFLAPPAGGTVMGYIELAKLLEDFVEVYGLQAPGLFEDEEPNFLEYNELVQFFKESIKNHYRPGIDYIGGHSLGGHIAYGMCQELTREAREPRGLIILDTTPSLKIIEDEDNAELSEDELKMMALVMGMGNMAGVDTDVVSEMAYEDAKAVILETARENEAVRGFMDEDYLDKYLKLQIHNMMMSRILELEEKPLPVDITVFKTLEHPEEIEMRFPAWKNYAGSDCNFVEIPGNHVSMLRKPHVSVLTEKIIEVVSCS